MQKKKIMAIGIAAALVLVAVAGVLLFLKNDEDPRHEPGIFISAGLYDFEWTDVEAGTTATEALSIGRDATSGRSAGILGSTDDVTAWTLWTMSARGKDWVKSTDDPDTVIISDTEYVAWSHNTGGEVHKPINPIDATGVNIISMISNAKRVVTLSASITEIVAAIDESKIVGTDDFSDFPATVKAKIDNKEIKTVGGYWTGLDFNMIVSTNPDLVIADGDSAVQESTVKRLRDSGITVLVITSHKGTVDEICRNISMIGLAMKDSEKAQTMSKNIVRITGELKNLVDAKYPTSEKPSMLFMMPPNAQSAYVAGSETTINSILVTLGLAPIGIDGSWPEISASKILGDNPKMVVLMGLYEPYTFNELKNHGVIGGMEAVTNGKVCILEDQSDSVMSRTGPRIVYAIGIVCWLLTNDGWPDDASGYTMNGMNYLTVTATLGVDFDIYKT
jgi:ABC-type Fe3+-hydroxamate transport system substrate-binding protein